MVVRRDPQADETQMAVAIHIFLEAMRGTGEGQRPWGLRPGTTMTNAAVETTLESVQGQSMVVKYRMGDRSARRHAAGVRRYGLTPPP